MNGIHGKVRQAAIGSTQHCDTSRTEHPAGQKIRPSQTPEAYAWRSMLYRCSNPKAPQYKDYGGRGITVCERWRESFRAFLDDMGTRPTKSHTLDRKDNNGNYEPGNCRWATRKEQNNNRRQRRNARLLTVRGETLPLCEWARRVGCSAGLIHGRIADGWTVERAVTQPVHVAERRRLGHIRARLTPEQVVAIRTLAGTRSQSAIAHEFGVCRETVNRLLRGRCYRRVA